MVSPPESARSLMIMAFGPKIFCGCTRWIKVPDKPGLGITLNEDEVRRHLAPGTGYFDRTPQWNQERSGDWLRSMIQSETKSQRA